MNKPELKIEKEASKGKTATVISLAFKEGVTAYEAHAKMDDVINTYEVLIGFPGATKPSQAPTFDICENQLVVQHVVPHYDPETEYKWALLEQAYNESKDNKEKFGCYVSYHHGEHRFFLAKGFSELFDFYKGNLYNTVNSEELTSEKEAEIEEMLLEAVEKGTQNNPSFMWADRQKSTWFTVFRM